MTNFSFVISKASVSKVFAWCILLLSAKHNFLFYFIASKQKKSYNLGYKNDSNNISECVIRTIKSVNCSRLTITYFMHYKKNIHHFKLWQDEFLIVVSFLKLDNIFGEPTCRVEIYHLYKDYIWIRYQASYCKYVMLESISIWR